MATRFTYQGKTLSDQDISVYIDDADFVGSSTDFEIENRAVTISHEGDARNRNQAVIPSSCSFSMLIENATHDAFITDLADAEEERFTVKVTKGTGLGESIVWVGYILPDLSVRDDIGYPFPLNIRATDGLGRLKGIDYEDSGAHYGVETFLTHILNCLTKGGLSALYYDASADVFLRTIVNWYDANHSTATDKCPLAYTQVNGKVWSRDNDQGETLFSSCYEVLESIAKGWGARLYYSGGAYRFETINARVNETLTERRFARDETLVSSAANVNYTKQLSQNTAGARLATGQLTYAPPLKEVKVKYHHNTYANYLENYNFWWILGAPTQNSVFVENNFVGGAGAKFVLSGRIKLNVSLDGGYTGPWVYVTQVMLRTYASSTYSYAHQDIAFQQIGGTYTIKRSPADPEWTTSVINYLEVSQTQPITSTSTFNGYVDFQFEIGNLVNGSQIDKFEVSITKYEARRFDGASLGSTVTEFAAKQLVLHVITGNEEEEGSLTQISNISNTNTSNSEVVEVETIFGSRIKEWTPAKLRTGSDGITWAESFNTWDVVGETANVSFSKLLAREIMAGQSTPKEIRTGGMWGEQLHAHSLMKINTDLYIYMGGDNNLIEEITNGEWVKVGRSTTEINDDGDTEEDPNIDIERVKTPFTFVKGKGHVSIDTNGILALAAITANVTASDIAAGSVTSIPVKYELAGDTWLTGDSILIVGQSTGIVERATLTADASSGDTTLSVSATFENDMGEDSLIVYDLLNKTTLEGGGDGFGGSKWTSGTGSAIYRESKVGVGTGLSSPGARLDVAEDSGSTPFVFNTYASGSVGTYFNFANTNTAGVNVIAMNEANNVSTIRAGLFRYGSTHSSTPGQFHVRNLLNASLVFATNNTNRITISGTGGVTVHPLAGTGNRLMQISATGVLSRSTIDPNSITNYTFTNGLTLSGTTVRLGGALTQNTMVDGSFAMSFNTNKFIVGNTTTTWTAPHVFTNTGATGTTLTSSTLHVAGNGGDQNAKLTLGVGDAYSAGVTHFFNGGSGITRLYNMTASQQIRFAIGSETSDKVVIAPDGIGRLGAGFSSLTGLVCTLQSAGSFGTNIVENTGNYTFGDEDCILVQTGTATSFYTLPAPATVKGRWFFVMNHSSQNTTLSTTVKNSFGAQFGTIDSGHHAIFSSDGTIYRGFRITSA